MVGKAGPRGLIRPLILFDLTRLVSATGRSAPTGIERVEYAYARWLLAEPSYHVRFVVTMKKGIRLVADNAVPAFLDKQSAIWDGGVDAFPADAALRNINRFLQGYGAPPAPKLGYLSDEERTMRRNRRHENGDRPSSPLKAWAQKMASSWASEPLGPVLRRSGARRPIVYLRASLDRMEWSMPFERLKNAADVRMVVLCHDIIPIDYPEFVRPNAPRQCAARLDTMNRLADGVVVSSHYSADRLRAFLSQGGPPLSVAHLGIAKPEGSADPLPLSHLVDEPFFLVVSTIEARKNHVLLLNLWRRFAEEMGPSAPKLIIAGKRGWEAQTPLAILDRARELGPSVYEVGAVPDSVLDLLRRKATAVLMPSFVEGFGMPVMEALAVGTPVLASDIPVFREIAAEGAELLDPLDGPSWKAAIMAFSDPHCPRAIHARAAAQRYTPPTWQEHFAAVRDMNRQVLEDPPCAGKASWGRRLITAGTALSRTNNALS